jgi:glucans biosynthesis protein C
MDAEEGVEITEATLVDGPRRPGNMAEKLPGLDRLRVIATGLVVLLHAAVPYALTPMPGLTWPVRHREGSPAIDLVFWGVACLVMPLFFWLSGFGATLALQHRGARQFLETRWRRLALPLAVAAVVLLPLELYIWLTGWALAGELPWVKLRSLKLGDYHQGLWGLSHLWYLQYLLLYCVGLVAVQALAQRASGLARFGNICLTVWATPARLPVLLLSAGLLLARWPEALLAFQHGFWPFPAKFVWNGLFFAAGVATAGCGVICVSRGWPGGVVCMVLLWHSLPLWRTSLTDHFGPGGVVEQPLPWQTTMLLAAYCCLGVTSLWDLFAVQRRRASALTNYLAKASYWTYLVHHPLVACCHVLLRPTVFPATIQWGLTAIATLVTCLFTYERFVRQTALGRFLEGEAPLRRVDLQHGMPAASASVVQMSSNKAAIVRSPSITPVAVSEPAVIGSDSVRLEKNEPPAKALESGEIVDEDSMTQRRAA